MLRRIHAESKPPSAGPRQCGRSSLSPFDYTNASEALIHGSLSAVGANEEWVEIELAAAESIPIMPSLASLRGMEYEVANGQSIPNLGERRCLVWTEGASQAKKMNMLVADVHKGLLSLSRCADMGFESRLGRRAGALICENTGEVIHPIRKGNFYVLRVWVKAVPFGRPEP